MRILFKKWALGLLLVGITFSGVFGENALGASFDDNKLFPKWNENTTHVLGKNGGTGGLNQAGKDTSSILFLLPIVTKFMLYATVPLVLVMTIYAGILMVTGHGEEETISKAKRYFIYAVIGFIFILG